MGIDCSDTEALDFAIKNGMIDMDGVRTKMMDAIRDQVLQKHNHKISYTAGRWVTRIDDPTAPRGMKQIFKTDKNDLLDFLIAYYEKQQQPNRNKNITLRELYPSWLTYKKLHTTASTYIIRIGTDWMTYYVAPTDGITQTKAGRELKKPIAPMPNIIDTPIRALTKIQCDEWAHTLIQGYDLSKVQYYNITLIIRQVLDYAVDSAIINSNPFSLVKIDSRRMFRKVQKKPDNLEVFTAAEEKAIISLARNDFDNHVQKVYPLAPLAVIFQFQTGLRLGELVSVKFLDIEKQNYIHIQRMWRRDTNELVEHPKTDAGDRQVFLTTEARKIIMTARKYQLLYGTPNEFIFSVDAMLKHRTIDGLYKKYCNKIGIPVKMSHKVRKTYVSTLLAAGCSINTVRQLAGHADERTTLKNYDFDRNGKSAREAQIEAALA